MYARLTIKPNKSISAEHRWGRERERDTQRKRAHGPSHMHTKMQIIQMSALVFCGRCAQIELEFTRHISPNASDSSHCSRLASLPKHSPIRSSRLPKHLAATMYKYRSNLLVDIGAIEPIHTSTDKYVIGAVRLMLVNKFSKVMTKKASGGRKNRNYCEFPEPIKLLFAFVLQFYLLRRAIQREWENILKIRGNPRRTVATKIRSDCWTRQTCKSHPIHILMHNYIVTGKNNTGRRK